MRLLEANPVIVPVERFVLMPELKAFNTFRSEKEITMLKEQIQVDGFIRDSVIVWVRGEDFVLVDGFNRHHIALDIAQPTLRAYLYEFRDMEEARYWIQLNQQSRRNLTDLQRAYFTGVMLNEVAEDKERFYSLLLAKGMDDIVRALQNTSTSRVNIFEWLADPLGSTETTLRRNVIVARVIDKVRELNSGLADEILSGEVATKNGGYQQVSMRQLNDIDKGMRRWPGKLTDWDSLMEALSMRKERDEKLDKSAGNQVLFRVQVSYKKFLKEPTEELYEEITGQLRAYLDEKFKGSSGLRKTA